MSPNAAPADPAQLAQFEQAQGQLRLRTLPVVGPSSSVIADLKANGNFQMLQAQLEGTENRIAVERGRFNDAALDYNSAIKRFPAVFFAAAFGFKDKAYFQAAPGTEKPPAVHSILARSPRRRNRENLCRTSQTWRGRETTPYRSRF